MKPVPGSIAESELDATQALDEFERAMHESIKRRAPDRIIGEVAACRVRRIVLTRVAEIRILLER